MWFKKKQVSPGMKHPHLRYSLCQTRRGIYINSLSIERELKKNSYANVKNLLIELFDKHDKHEHVWHKPPNAVYMNDWTYDLLCRQLDNIGMKTIWGAEIVIDELSTDYELFAGEDA